MDIDDDVRSVVFELSSKAIDTLTRLNILCLGEWHGDDTENVTKTFNKTRQYIEEIESHLAKELVQHEEA